MWPSVESSVLQKNTKRCFLLRVEHEYNGEQRDVRYLLSVSTETFMRPGLSLNRFTSTILNICWSKSLEGKNPREQSLKTKSSFSLFFTWYWIIHCPNHYRPACVCMFSNVCTFVVNMYGNNKAQGHADESLTLISPQFHLFSSLFFFKAWKRIRKNNSWH